jgi:hypothetical protein
VKRALLLAAVAIAAGACGKPPEPKVDAATERAQATERAKKDVFGTQVKALENAKSIEGDMNRKAQDNLDKADAMSK